MFWWRRLQVAPLSIKIAVWMLVAQTAVALLFGSQAMMAGQDPLGPTAIVAFSLYAIVALSRLSRLPLVILAAAHGAGFAVWAVIGYGGLAIILHGLAEVALLALLVLPHWRLLSWRPFGVEPGDDPRSEDIFD